MNNKEWLIDEFECAWKNSKEYEKWRIGPEDEWAWTGTVESERSAEPIVEKIKFYRKKKKSKRIHKLKHNVLNKMKKIGIIDEAI